jgi:DNA-binding transcriptional ArsR family regulator
MAAPDEIIHQQTRLKIMATLNALPDRDRVEFGRLKAILGATDGNLGAHLTTLENAGYISIEKDFVGKKPRTRVAMTRAGRKAFGTHVAYLRDILDGVPPAQSKGERGQ